MSFEEMTVAVSNPATTPIRRPTYGHKRVPGFVPDAYTNGEEAEENSNDLYPPNTASKTTSGDPKFFARKTIQGDPTHQTETDSEDETSDFGQGVDEVEYPEDENTTGLHSHLPEHPQYGGKLPGLGATLGTGQPYESSGGGKLGDHAIGCVLRALDQQKQDECTQDGDDAAAHETDVNAEPSAKRRKTTKSVRQDQHTLSTKSIAKEFSDTTAATQTATSDTRPSGSSYDSLKIKKGRTATAQAIAATPMPAAAINFPNMKCDTCQKKKSPKECQWRRFGQSCRQCQYNGATCKINDELVSKVVWPAWKSNNPTITNQAEYAVVAPVYVEADPGDGKGRGTRKGE